MGATVVQERLQEFGGAGQHIVLAHANGYPPGSYRQFIDQLLPVARVTGYNHRPLWSTRVPEKRLRWSYFARDLVHTLEQAFTEPVWLAGHSMGATIGLLAAAGSPRLFRGLILIDPVLTPVRRVVRTLLASRRTLRDAPMIRKTLGRPRYFSDVQAAFDFHRGRRAFRRFSDAALWDYVAAGTRPSAAGGVELAYSPEWEASVYESQPWVWPALARVRLPTLGLRGEHSDTLSQGMFERWRRLQPQAELHQCPGGHLLPLEEPVSTAGYVIDFLRRQGD
jgi:pimeloyl-ACP methyl ester carboxylesterase